MLVIFAESVRYDVSKHNIHRKMTTPKKVPPHPILPLILPEMLSCINCIKRGVKCTYLSKTKKRGPKKVLMNHVNPPSPPPNPRLPPPTPKKATPPPFSKAANAINARFHHYRPSKNTKRAKSTHLLYPSIFRPNYRFYPIPPLLCNERERTLPQYPRNPIPPSAAPPSRTSPTRFREDSLIHWYVYAPPKRL